jgi:hypothetical protein
VKINNSVNMLTLAYRPYDFTISQKLSDIISIIGLLAVPSKNIKISRLAYTV